MSTENINETISVAFFGSESWSDGETSVKCPTCGELCTHFSGARSASSNQPGIILTFSGECGHIFEITFGGHKGVVYVSAVDITAEVMKVSAFLAERGLADAEHILSSGSVTWKLMPGNQ